MTNSEDDMPNAVNDSAELVSEFESQEDEYAKFDTTVGAGSQLEFKNSNAAYIVKTIGVLTVLVALLPLITNEEIVGIAGIVSGFLLVSFGFLIQYVFDIRNILIDSTGKDDA